jgi:hypothetical protein
VPIPFSGYRTEQGDVREAFADQLGKLRSF